MTDTTLSVENLSVSLRTDRGYAPIVRDLSFSVRKGATLGIVGESGCGKSMTALAVMGLLPDSAQTSGRILLDGRDLLAASESEMCEVRGARIGMVFQEPMTTLNPAHTIGHQVAEGLRLHRGLGARAALNEAGALLDLVGIPNARARLGDFPHQFSGGQRQRIVIAMALSCKPELLVADEPTTALDVTVQLQILELLERLVAELGMSLIVISHDLGVIGRLCDDVMVMYAGQAVEQGTAAAVFDAPSHPYTKGLFGALPEAQTEIGARLYTIPGIVPSPFDLPEGCKFADRCGYVLPACREDEPDLLCGRLGQQARCIRIREVAA
ncbi:ABC transporter ATP-binding protein [Nitratireductor aquimarinus]|uniref:ABC transporter ATP-binding protein n=1 Tax=Nitratireductor aquimarinus TaxID=889300 RepID=UPI001A8C23A9|nr:ABC transporter ATP-binding protein [Nitratireductor aquimarinus]MBN8245722.1 ABC transporter ATP-binding protein [Nitratireductor aquimarinus]MBY6134103.1 ABC transporter ATP-binding protein [Nitratireductor aquimarinus]MCA1305206.1 ABC transporter ATP-binding protein [Nitratireductor aquimarinus]